MSGPSSKHTSHTAPPVSDPSKTSFSGSPPPAPSEEDDGRITELSFKEIRRLEEEMRERAQKKSARELETIRKKREKDALLGKGPSTEQVSLDEIDPETVEERLGGMPEEIASLPADHPIRARWEKGFRERPDGTWHKIYVEKRELRRIEKVVHRVKARFVMLLVVFLAIVIPMGVHSYQKTLKALRKEIVTVLDSKGIAQDDPWILKQHGHIARIQWIPTLNTILVDVQEMPRSFSLFPDNPEPGSYLEHISTHNKPFDPEEAMDWDSRLLRKPPQQ